MARAFCTLAFLVAAVVVAAPAARADGDPASDWLISQDVFLPFNSNISTGDAARFAALVRDARDKGYQIKVAVIAKPYDLGTVGVLYRKPQQYARFLGQELFFVWKERLLIVMPNGYGISRIGRPIARERRALAALPRASSTRGTDLLAAATTAVERLAGAGGVHVSAPKGGNATADRIRIVAAVVIALILVGGGVLFRKMWRASRLGRVQEETK